MKNLTLIISICFLICNLSAHCDGCGTNKKHEHGTLKGNIKYQGKIPKPKPLKMDSDPVCGSSHDERMYSESFIVDEDMNLKNVLVWLKDVEFNGPTSTDAVIIDQVGCLYIPHVLGAMKGQKLIIKNIIYKGYKKCSIFKV